MESHEPVPMTRRRYRSLVAAAEDAARTSGGGAATTAPVRRGVLAALPLPRTRRRASIRRLTPTP